MGLWLLLLIFVVSATSQVYVPITTAVGNGRIFPQGASATVSVALSMQPCSYNACASNHCTHNYCALQADGSCSGTLNATFNIVLSVPIACCTSSDSNCLSPRLGGSYMLNTLPNFVLSGNDGLCAGNEYWMPMFSPTAISPTPAIATVSLGTGNNPFIVLYANITVAISQGAPLPFPNASIYTIGPVAGFLPDSVDCTVTGKASDPSDTGDCTGWCGCLSVTLISRAVTADIVGPGTVGVEYTFEGCALCKKLVFDYLSFCDPPPASGVIVTGIGANQDDIYDGVRCSYDTAHGSCSPLALCPDSFCWDVIDGCKKFESGACDTFKIKTLGLSDDWLIEFTGKAGEENVIQRFNVSLAECPDGNAPTISTWTCSADSKAYGPACDQCLFPKTPTAVAVAYCVPIDGGNFRWILLKSDSPVPPNAFLPGTTDPVSGFNTTCSCAKIYNNCSTNCADDSANCLCNGVTGQCRADGVCSFTLPSCTLPPGQANSCPIGPYGECNGNGACVCGKCVCATNNGVIWRGEACDQADDCSQYTDCASCSISAINGNGCSWCRLGNGAMCLSNTTCDELGGGDWTCDGSLVVSSTSCPNNCMCDGKPHGKCQTEGDPHVCMCSDGWTGPDCCMKDTDNSGKVAAGIVGGVIAAIVIAAVVVCVATGWGVKMGVHWARIRHLVAAARNNPLYGDEENSAAPPSEPGSAVSEAPSEADTKSEGAQSRTAEGSPPPQNDASLGVEGGEASVSRAAGEAEA